MPIEPEYLPPATDAFRPSNPRSRAAALAASSAASRKRLGLFLLLPLLALALLLAAAGMADAKRLGGGSSFGSKPSYGSGYSKPVAPAPGPSTMQRQATPGQQPGAAQPAKGGFFSRFGGMGGMLGGMLMGGLIGSMLFGGGFGGPGMLDLLLLGAGGFLLFKFLRARRAASGAEAQPAAAYSGAGRGPVLEPEAASGGWDRLRTAERPAPQAPQSPVLPRGIDEDEFLTGAKALYARLQDSWDRREIEDIRTFTSPEVHAEIARQAVADPTPGRTDILMVQARVLEARENGPETVVSVLFDVLLREDAGASQPAQTREVWHFRRDESAPRPEWLLEGIQQLES